MATPSKRDREKHAAYMKEWHRNRMANDPEYRVKKLAYLHRYRQDHANRTKANAANAAYRAKNRGKISDYGKRYYAKNKARQRATIRKKKYGITTDTLLSMLDAQSGLCAVCGEALPEDHGRIAIDHCHETGETRGLLHIGCNVAVGAYERLHKQIERYLRTCSKSSKSQPPPRPSSAPPWTPPARPTPASSSPT